MISWEGITALTGIVTLTGGGLIGFGKMRQRMDDMRHRISDNAAKTAEHDKRLNDSTSGIKVIDVKIDNLLTNQSDLKNQITKMDDRLRQHCEARSE
jgi:predicted transcriptional regulator